MVVIGRAFAAASGVFALHQGGKFFAAPKGDNVAGTAIYLRQGKLQPSQFWLITEIQPDQYTIVNNVSGLYFTGQPGNANTLEDEDSTNPSQLWTLQRHGTGTSKFHIYNLGPTTDGPVLETAGAAMEGWTAGDTILFNQQRPATKDQLWSFFSPREV